MNDFQLQIIIKHLNSKDNLNELPLETILKYIEGINASKLPLAEKQKYISQLRDIFISTVRDPRETILIAKIAGGLSKYNKVPYG